MGFMGLVKRVFGRGEAARSAWGGRSEVVRGGMQGSAFGASDDEQSAFLDEVMGYKVWYRGVGAELQQYYEMGDDGVGNSGFWGSRSSSGVSFRKVHSGLPGLVVDTLADIVCDDLVSVSVGRGEQFAKRTTSPSEGWELAGQGCSGDKELVGQDCCDDEANDSGIRQEIWDEIWDENEMGALVRRAVREVLVCGDGAFKINVDGEVSSLPVIEFISGDRVEYVYKRGRLVEVRFRTVVADSCDGEGGTPGTASPTVRKRDGCKEAAYLLVERYGVGYVKYELYDEKGNAVPLGMCEATAGLGDVSFGREIMMAVPVRFDESGRFSGRGKSVFDGKTGLFDGLDEVISQWVDALRTGRPNVYIPGVLLPRDSHTGAVLRPNGFDNRYIQTQGDLVEGAENKIEVVQPDIKTGALMDSYVAFLDMCLQGVIAPSTIGVDCVVRRDNAEAQREREKATIYTRNRLICGLRLVLERLAKSALAVWEMMYEVVPCEVEVSVTFGEYANPSFEAQVETVGKAVGYGIMSLETAVEELYGDSWSDAEKVVEIERLRKIKNSGGV